MKNKYLFTICICLLLPSNPIKASCLDEAADFAKKLCGEISNRGTDEWVSVDGHLTAQAKGAITKILGTAEASGSAERVIEKYDNVVHSQLSGEHANFRDCTRDMAKVALAQCNKSSLDIESKNRLASALDNCRSGDFSESDTIFTSLRSKYPENKPLHDAVEECDELRSRNIAANISFQVGQGVFLEGHGGETWLASFMLNVDYYACDERYSNLRGADVHSCSIKPGLHNFKLKYFTLYDSNKNPVSDGNGNCGGYAKFSPSVNNYGIIICLAERTVRCSIYPADDKFFEFSYGDCKFTH